MRDCAIIAFSSILMAQFHLTRNIEPVLPCFSRQKEAFRSHARVSRTRPIFYACLEKSNQYQKRDTSGKVLVNLGRCASTCRICHIGSSRSPVFFNHVFNRESNRCKLYDWRGADVAAISCMLFSRRCRSRLNPSPTNIMKELSVHTSCQGSFTSVNSSLGSNFMVRSLLRKFANLDGQPDSTESQRTWKLVLDGL
jgi:hypothetical protein